MRTSVSIGISQTILFIFSFAFIARYADSQHGYHNIWIDIVWWFDKAATAIAILIAITIFILEERRTRKKERDERKERISRSCDTLLREIRENRGHLIRGDDRISFSYRENKDTVDYSNTVFDTYAFQSVIHSGLLTYFEEDIQAKLVLLYSRIDGHNESLKYRSRLQTEFFSFATRENIQNYRSENEVYELFLTRIDEDIKQLSPVVEQSLEELRRKNVTNV